MIVVLSDGSCFFMSSQQYLDHYLGWRQWQDSHAMMTP